MITAPEGRRARTAQAESRKHKLDAGFQTCLLLIAHGTNYVFRQPRFIEPPLCANILDTWHITTNKDVTKTLARGPLYWNTPSHVKEGVGRKLEPSPTADHQGYQLFPIDAR